MKITVHENKKNENTYMQDIASDGKSSSEELLKLLNDAQGYFDRADKDALGSDDKSDLKELSLAIKGYANSRTLSNIGSALFKLSEVI